MGEYKKTSGQARGIRAKKHRQKKVHKQNKSGILCIGGILIILFLVVSVRIFAMYQTNQELKVKESEVMAELEAEQERAEEIKEYERYVKSPEYIEQLAKSKLGLLYPNEIVFKEEKKEP